MNVLDGERRLQIHDHGCQCWPHVSEDDAVAAIVEVARVEYLSGHRQAAILDVDRLARAIERQSGSGYMVNASYGEYARAVAAEYNGQKKEQR